VSLGLSITMGLMNFVNLAHGAFAMAGGFVCVVAMARFGVPFLAALPLAFVVTAAAGAVLERFLYRRLYRASHLDQVLFSIGLTFMAVAGATYFFGASQQPVRLPEFLRGQVSVAGADFGVYRLFLVALVAVLGAVLTWLVAATRFGARVRAAVDDPVAARGLGIDVDRVFSIAFALGSGLAGLGGALGIEVLGLDSAFPLTFMVYFLLVVVVGGAGSIAGAAAAAILLGVLDVAGKYYVPQAGAFVIYAAMVVLLVAFPPDCSGGADDDPLPGPPQGEGGREVAFWLRSSPCISCCPDTASSAARC
jgi:branched-chain amino acid transport system permease protein